MGYSILAQLKISTQIYFASKIQRVPQVCICFFIGNSSGYKSSFPFEILSIQQTSELLKDFSLTSSRYLLNEVSGMLATSSWNLPD